MRMRTKWGVSYYEDSLSEAHNTLFAGDVIKLTIMVAFDGVVFYLGAS